MYDHKIIVLMGGKRGLDAQRQRLEGAHCISATCIQLNSSGICSPLGSMELQFWKGLTSLVSL